MVINATIPMVISCIGKKSDLKKKKTCARLALGIVLINFCDDGRVV